ncbi:MAG: TrmH family RNA methyltransferase [Bacteroidetes bacterium]|nr:MAG: TrmH family RNA methyltransferase [Bacteroidota bacterium]
MQKSKNEELGRISPEEYKASDKMPIVVVLDNIRSMNNIGSAFRTSDAFLVEKIILTGITAQPPHREINKTALGATDSVPWQYFASVSDAIVFLQKENYHILAIEQAHESTLLHEFIPAKEQKYAVIFGNEVKGVSDEVMQVADGCLEIPQLGTKHSLNISVSIGVVLWDLSSKLGLF